MATETKADTSEEALRGTLPGGTRLRNYELISVLGHGGFGITYFARDTVLSREVAIKEYLPAELAIREDGTMVVPRSTQYAEDFIWGRERFLEEARILATLDHAPAVVRVFDFMEAHGTAYMVMGLARGDTLEQRLKRDGPLRPQIVERMLRRLLDGLEEVHQTGFMHRDIKPANIILDANDNPTLIDFGASRASMADRTAALTAIFTPRYAAAEQLTSEKQGPWTDIYGLSATIYHAVTGRPPPSSVERALDDVYEPLASQQPPGYSRSFLVAIDAGLTVRANDRPQSIERWRSELFAAEEPDGSATIVRGRSHPIGPIAGETPASPSQSSPGGPGRPLHPGPDTSSPGQGQSPDNQDDTWQEFPSRSSQARLGQPSQGHPVRPSQGRLDVPSQGRPEVPSQGRLDVPSQGRPAQPLQGRLDVPSQGSPAQPSQGRLDVPSQGRPAQPSQGRLDVPSQGRLAQPSQGRLDVPSQGRSDPPSQNRSGQAASDPTHSDAPFESLTPGPAPSLPDARTEVLRGSSSQGRSIPSPRARLDARSEASQLGGPAQDRSQSDAITTALPSNRLDGLRSAPLGEPSVHEESARTPISPSIGRTASNRLRITLVAGAVLIAIAAGAGSYWAFLAPHSDLATAAEAAKRKADALAELAEAERRKAAERQAAREEEQRKAEEAEQRRKALEAEEKRRAAEIEEQRKADEAVARQAAEERKRAEERRLKDQEAARQAELQRQRNEELRRKDEEAREQRRNEERQAEEQRRKAAAEAEEQKRKIAEAEEQKRKAAELEEQKRKAAAEAEERRRKAAAEAEEQKRKVAEAEEQKRKAAELEEQKRKAAAEAEERRRKAAAEAEEQKRKVAEADEQRRRAAAEEQKRKAAELEEQKRKAAAEAEEQKRKAAEVEEQKRKAAAEAEEQRRKAAAVEEQKRKAAAEAEEQRRKAAAVEEQERKAAAEAEEQKRKAAAVEDQKRRAAEAEEQRRKAAEAEEQKRKAAAEVEEQRKIAAAEEAKKRKTDEDAKRGAEAAEKALGLSLLTLQHVQIALRAKGFDPGGIDGSFGPRTRIKIEEWQRARNHPATGYLDQSQVDRLLEEAAVDIQKFEDERKRKLEDDRRRMQLLQEQQRNQPPRDNTPVPSAPPQPQAVAPQPQAIPAPQASTPQPAPPPAAPKRPTIRLHQ